MQAGPLTSTSLFALLIFIAVLPVNSGFTRTYDNCLVVDVINHVQFHWSFRDEKTIDIGLQGKFGGYVAVGLSKDGTMSGGGFADAWAVDVEGSMIDLYMPDKKTPRLDSQQDITNILTSFEGGVLQAEFTRSLNTNDPNDYVIDPGTSVFLVWAGNPVSKFNASTTIYHKVNGVSYAGAIEVNWLSPSTCDSNPILIGQRWTTLESPNQEFTVQAMLDANSVYFAMNGDTNGWVSIGFSNSPSSDNTDTYVGWVADSGAISYVDGWTANGVTLSDAALGGKASGVAIGAETGSGYTYFEFRRKLVTGDSFDFQITPATSSCFLLWAIGSAKGTINGTDVTIPSLIAEGSFQVEFVIPTIPTAANKTNTTTTSTPSNNTAKTPTASIAPEIMSASDWGNFTADSGDFKFLFKIVDETIYMIMSAKTNGWVSVGLGTNPLMSNSDTYTAWITSTGLLVFRDEWSANYKQPILDSSKRVGGTASILDATVYNYTYLNGWTTVVFSRLLNTGDPMDVQIADGSKYYLIWAHSSAKGSDDGTSYQIHDSTGNQLVDFHQPESLAARDTFFDLKFKISAGFTLLLLVGSVIFVWTVIHWSKILWKRYFGVIFGKVTIGPSLAGRNLVNQSSTPYFTTDSTSTQREIRWAKDPVCPTDPGAVYFNNEFDTQTVSANNSMSSDRAPVGVVHRKGFYKGATLVTRDSTSSLKSDDSSSSAAVLLKQVSVSRISNTSPNNGDEEDNDNDDNYDADVEDVAKDSDNYNTIEEKTACCTPLYGFWHTRIRGQQISIGDVFIGVVFVLLNGVSMFLFGQIAYAITIPGILHSVGSLVAANSVLTVITATRNSLLVYCLGIPFDRTIMFHRWLGVWVIFLSIAHSVLIFVNASIQQQSFTEEIISDIFSVPSGIPNIYGAISVSATILLIFFSLSYIRRTHYELFLYTHYAIALVFFIFSTLHADNFKPFAIISCVFYGIDVVLRVLWGGFPRVTTVLQKRKGGFTQIRFKKPFSKLIKYKVGQYVFVNFPEISISEWHPFSVASAPTSDEIEIFVKSLGNWTSKLNKQAACRQSMIVRMDGPYGNLNLNYHRYPKILLVSGGIGVTPILGILRDIFSVNQYTAIKHVTVVVTFKTLHTLTCFSEVINEIRSNNSGTKTQLDLHVYITGHSNKDDESPVVDYPFGVSYNRPNLGNIFDTFTKRQIISSSNSSNKNNNNNNNNNDNVPSFVFVCGPKKIVNICWDLSKKHTMEGKVVHFHHETFNF